MIEITIAKNKVVEFGTLILAKLDPKVLGVPGSQSGRIVGIQEYTTDTSHFS